MIRPKNKKLLSKQQAYAERIKMKRILSKPFDREWKRKKAAAQAKWRRKKKDQLKIIAPTSITSSLNPTDLRKQEGQKRR